MSRFLLTFVLATCLCLVACGQNEQTQRKLFEEIVRRSAINDSLKKDLIHAGGKINLLQSVNDSLQKSGEVFQKKIQQLDKEAKKYRSEAEAHRRANNKLQTEIKQIQAEINQLESEINQLESEKYADSQEITKLRDELSSLSAKLDRQKNIIEEEKKRVQEARQNQNSVRLMVGTERYLKASGFLKTGRAFLRKSYKMVKKPASDNSRVKIVPIGESVNIRSGLKALVGYNGKLKNGDDYRMKKHGWSTTITFTNRVLGGTSVLAIVED